MAHVRLILAIHNHQPVGNFDGVFESAYKTSYKPFLDVFADYPEIPFCLHTSGPLLEWLVAHKNDYVARLRAIVQSGQVEILGGAYFEPILTMIPVRDRIGQIRTFSAYLKDKLGAAVRGMWVPERVWEQSLASAIVDAGIEYTVLDDFHFEHAGCAPDQVFGYYITEDEGRLLKIFPAAEALRYSMPFQEPHATYTFLKHLAETRPGSTVVFADDGEKFGAWPKTFDHVYTNHWLRHFCDMLRANSSWIETTTFARAISSTRASGKIFVPDGSYREMTEWVLTPEALHAFREGARRVAALPDGDSIRRFYRAGGFWRNFKVRYPESDLMYCRMLSVSRRLQSLETDTRADSHFLQAARRELHRGQCNCPYWHGSFGGLYFPHLRNAIYGALISADNALDAAQGRRGNWADIAVDDFNLDALPEVRLENDRLIAWISPACGGHLYELDVREHGVNLLATLARRPEVYHAELGTMAAERDEIHGARGQDDDHGTINQLVYDLHPRTAFVDHFWPANATLDDVVAGRAEELGDFATGAYRTEFARHDSGAQVAMERAGQVAGHSIALKKTISLEAGDSGLTVHYEFADLPVGVLFHFAVEINVAAMAGHAPDRFFSLTDGTRMGLLDARLELSDVDGITLTDGWLDLELKLRWTKLAGLWSYPIETVSKSEGGIERVYQSSVLIIRWMVAGDANGRFSADFRYKCGRQTPQDSPQIAQM
jgi:alpha-amylase